MPLKNFPFSWRKAGPILLLAVVGLAAVGVWLQQQRQKKADAERQIAYKQRCSDLTDKGDWERLESVAKEWTDWEPETDDGWLYLADSYLQRQDVLSAQRYLLNVPDTSPKALDSLLLASELQFGAAKRPLQVPATIARVVNIAPGLITARRRLIFYYAMTLQRVDMVKAIRDAMAANAEPVESYVYLMISDHLSFTNGVQMTREWITENPDNEILEVASAIHLADLMENSESASDEPEAAKVARSRTMVNLLSKYPSNPTLLNYFLDRKVRDFDTDAVDRLLEQFPEEARDDSLYWRFRGWAAAQHNEGAAAEEAYRKSLELNRLDWHTWHELAGVLRKAGELDEAEKLQAVAVIGKTLRSDLQQIPDVASPESEHLLRIHDYAERCGDQFVADALAVRLEQMGVRARENRSLRLPAGN